MADWNDLKMAFEREYKKQEQTFISNEQTLLEAIANHLASSKGMTALMNYDTDEMLAFLEKPVDEIKEAVGGEWLEVDETALNPLIYSLTKKIKKSSSLLGNSRR